MLPAQFQQHPAFGLHTDKDSVPLQRVRVTATLIDFLSEVMVEQHYRNNNKEAVEVVYKFPLDSQAVLKSFEIEIDRRVIRGKVQESQQAADTYDDALASGHGAVLVQQDMRMQDVFTCRVGNLPPDAAAIVRLTYVAQVDEEVDATDDSTRLRFVIPTAVGPRYEPPSQVPSGLANHAAQGRVARKEGHAEDLLEIRGTITTATRILELEPLSHTGIARTDITAGKDGKHATFEMSSSALSQDFVLSIKLADRLQDRAWIQGNAIAVSAGLKPDSLVCSNDTLSEYIFIIDRSGSMGGSRIKAAQEALSLCVAALPVNSTFNIVGFGTTHTMLFHDSKVFDDASRDEALRHCEQLNANYGGTEILGPLRAVAATKPSQDKPRQVFVITDGEVSNTKDVVEFVRKDHRHAGTRYFAFGIGSGASRDLVKGVADAGEGHAEFIVEGERAQGKIMQQMNCALQPVLINVTIDFSPLKLTTHPSPRHPRPLYPGNRLLFFALLDTTSLLASTSTPASTTHTETPASTSTSSSDSPTKTSTGALSAVALCGRSPDGDVSVRVPVVVAGDEGSGEAVKTLATRAVLKDYEDVCDDEGATKEEMNDAKVAAIALSTSSGVVCRFTSLVAVDERSEAVCGAMKAVHVPLSMHAAQPQAAFMGFGAPMMHAQAQQQWSLPLAVPMGFGAAPPPPSCAAPASTGYFTTGFGGVDPRARESAALAFGAPVSRAKAGGFGCTFGSSTASGACFGTSTGISGTFDSTTGSNAFGSSAGSGTFGARSTSGTSASGGFGGVLFGSSSGSVPFGSSTAGTGGGGVGGFLKRALGGARGGQTQQTPDVNAAQRSSFGFGASSAMPQQFASLSASPMGGGGQAIGSPRRGSPGPGGAVLDLFGAQLDDAPMEMDVCEDEDGGQSPSLAASHARLDKKKMMAPSAAQYTPTPTTVTTTPTDHISIIRQQKASGEWVLDEWVAKAVGVPLSKLQSERGGVEESVWATALILALLMKSNVQYANEWEAAAKKARRWMERVYQSGSVVDLMSRAQAVLA